VFMNYTISDPQSVSLSLKIVHVMKKKMNCGKLHTLLGGGGEDPDVVLIRILLPVDSC
jgi:hypothetical protein